MQQRSLREQRKSRALPIVLGLVGAYVLFVVAVVALWDDSPERPDEMDWDDRQHYNAATIATLTLGMAQSEVVTKLGSPDFNEAFTDPKGSQVQILRYRTHRLKGDGLTTEDETTPLLFRDGKLLAWGDTALQALTD